MTTLHADISPNVVEAAPGQQVHLTITVSNLSALIDGYGIRFFGLDPQWVELSPRRLSLFPGDAGSVDATISLPADFPAGVRMVSIHVQSENSPGEFVLTSLSIDVASAPRVTLTLDPQSQTVGSKAQFGLVVANHGNSVVEGVPDAIDPEEEAQFDFTPNTVRLLPGEQDVVQVSMKAPRPWVGSPKVRVLTFGLEVRGRVETVGTLIQRPRIGRALITLLGLITAAAVFAAVLSRTLSNVVDQARVKDVIIDQALSNGADSGPDEVTNPASIYGTVKAGSNGQPTAGVTVALFLSSDSSQPIQTSATSDSGEFRFTGLAAGDYRVRFSGSGFVDVWFTGGRNFAEAANLHVNANENLNLDTLTVTTADGAAAVARPGAATGAAAAGGIALAGVAGTVSGTVVAVDPTGATATLVVDPGIADKATPGVVATIGVSANGTFVLANIPTPQKYSLIIERSGNATETRTIDLGPGDSATGLEIPLRSGEGVITGFVTTDGTSPVEGALVEASDGVNVVSTVSLTEGLKGTFALRNLAVPGVYTVTVTAPGYARSSQVVQLTDSKTPESRKIFLVPSIGVIAGKVTDQFGDLGGVTVKVDGASGSVTTTTTSQGPGVGTYVVPTLPIPGSYTITFSKAGYLDQVHQVQLDVQGPNPPEAVNASLRTALVTVKGSIFKADQTPAKLAVITLTSGTFVRTTFSSTQSPSTFEFGAIPPGSYTFTASLAGAEPIVTIVNVTSGQDVKDLGRLNLGEQASISGHVTFAGTPPPAAEVRLYLPDAFPPTPGATPAQGPVVLDADGNFTFTGVEAPVSYVIALFSGPGSFTPLASDVVVSQPGAPIRYDKFDQVPVP